MWRQVGRSLGALVILGVARAASAQTAPAAAPPVVAPGVEAPPPPSPPTSECFPSCRAGYTCYQAQCVSLCNPPCGDGQSCTAAGECTTPAPPPPPPPAPTPVAPPPPIAPAPPPPVTSCTEPSALRDPGTFVFAGHVGLELIGLGTREDETCENGTCAPALNSDYDDKSPFVLGVDGLLHATRGLRLGLGYWLVPYSAIGAEPNKATTIHLGSEHALNFIVEGVAALRPNLALALRAQGGPRLLVSGGDLANSLDSYLSACSRMPVDNCEADKGPFFGGQFGTTVGLLFGNRVRGRVDFGVERYAVKAGERRLLDGTQTLSGTSSNAGTRFWLLGGVEL